MGFFVALNGGKDMEPLTKEKLEEVKKFAESLGFYVSIGFEVRYASFEIALPSANITVLYEINEAVMRTREIIGASVSCGWTSCDGGQCSVAQTQDFIKSMGYAVQIAEKLKEA
jgi:hypothetical protein